MAKGAYICNAIPLKVEIKQMSGISYKWIENCLMFQPNAMVYIL